jgi:hypothetical protein
MLEDDRSRFRQKALLPALLAAGVTPEMAQLAVRQPGKRSGRDPKVIDAYVHMADAQRVLYWDLEPAMLVDAALAHTRLGVELLGDSGARGRSRASTGGRRGAKCTVVCAFEHLGVSERMISKWEAGREAINPRPVYHAALDTCLTHSDPNTQARFGHLTGSSLVELPRIPHHGELSQPAAAASRIQRWCGSTLGNSAHQE